MDAKRSLLIVVCFDHADEAHRVLATLRITRQRPLLSLAHSVIVARDAAGEISVAHIRARSAKADAGCGQILSLIADLVVGSDLGEHEAGWGSTCDDSIATLANLGIDNRFIATVGRALSSDRSALLLLVAPEYYGELHELLRMLAPILGTLHLTSFAPETEIHAAGRAEAVDAAYGEPAILASAARTLIQLDGEPPGSVLTRRELEVLALVVSGKHNNAIAATLAISRGTVRIHVSNILAKLGASNRTQAAMLAMRRRLLT